MKILIADRSSQTKNYEAALLSLRADFEISLSLRSADSASRLLLPGGGDIRPSRYGQPDSGAQDIDEELDEVQFSLLDTFVRAGKPVLGICKGLQIINVYFGGDLLNLRTAPIHKSRGRDRQHAVYSLPGSLLYSLYGPCCTVNSAHHQACGRIGYGLFVTQHAPDGSIEALEHKNLPVLGVQWHPKRAGVSFGVPGIADGTRLFDYFIRSTPRPPAQPSSYW